MGATRAGLQPFGFLYDAADGAGGLVLSPGLRRYGVETRDGARIATLCGLILDPAPDSGLVRDGARIVAAADIDTPEAFEDRILAPLQGSFIAVTEGALPRRLYPDCATSLPVVYDPSAGRAATSAGLMFDAPEYGRRFLHDRHRRLIGARGPERWIPGTLTAHAGLHRLLPGHHLDLGTWTAHRHWPRRQGFARDASREDAAGIVAARLRHFFTAAARDHPLRLALTAGYDSRLLAAAACAAGVRVDCFTLGPARGGLDQIMAGEIARHLGLAHQSVAIRRADAAGETAWDHAVGHAIRHGNRSVHPSLAGFAGDLILSGILGEPARARLYAGEIDTIDGQRLDAAGLLARMKLPQDAEVIADLSGWLAGLDWLPTSAVLDLAVLELFYMPHWRPAQCAVQTELMPLVDRAIQAAFLAVPPREKGRDALFRACIAALRPEALALPVNRFGDYRDHVFGLRKLVSRDRLARFLHA